MEGCRNDNFVKIKKHKFYKGRDSEVRITNKSKLKDKFNKKIIVEEDDYYNE